jgi:choline dehydrogenase-like flavoprotein
VVGAGAGGGIIAKELAVAGLRVMLLDGGPSFTAWQENSPSSVPSTGQG